MSTTEKRQKVVRTHPRLSLRKQCELLQIHRSGLYYKPKQESDLNLALMREIDGYFTRHPYYSVVRMTYYLNSIGYKVNVKRIRRLYRVMRLNTLYPKLKTTSRNESDEHYPYLLKGLEIHRSNLV